MATKRHKKRKSENLAHMASNNEGHYEGANFSVEFYFETSEPVLEVNAVLRGTTTASQSMLALLERRFGWITTHP